MVVARVVMLWAVVTAPSAAALASAGGQSPAVSAGEARQAPEAVIEDEADVARDPFVRPAAPDSGRPAEGRPAGLSGLAVDEAVLRGIVSTERGRLAVLEGIGARTYVVRPGDRLHDGKVREIAGDAVLFLRDAGDSTPLAGRLVRRRLRDTGSAR